MHLYAVDHFGGHQKGERKTKKWISTYLSQKKVVNWRGPSELNNLNDPS